MIGEKTKQILRWQWFNRYSIKKRVSILYLAVLAGVSIDALLSYLAYLRNPLHFIQNEQSWEAMMWVRDGAIPYFTPIMLIVLPVSLYYMLKQTKHMDDDVMKNASYITEKRQKRIQWFIASSEISIYEVCFALCFLRIIGGLSWWVDIRIIGALFGFGVGYIIACAAVICIFIFAGEYSLWKLKKEVKKNGEKNIVDSG
jgi:hypothetical protein